MPAKNTIAAANPSLAFTRLAETFLSSANPKLEREVVILDCIYAYDGVLTSPIRRTAHAFFRAAEKIIELGGKASEDPLERWIAEWNKKHGV